MDEEDAKVYDFWHPAPMTNVVRDNRRPDRPPAAPAPEPPPPRHVQLHLAFQGWRRYLLAVRTLDSLAALNPLQAYQCWYALDGEGDPRIHELLESFGFTEAYRPPHQSGVARVTDRLVRAVSERGHPEDLLVLLQEDWECVRPLPVAAMLEALDGHAEAWRLVGEQRERRPGRQRSWRRSVDGTHNGPATAWAPAEFQGERVQIGRSFMGLALSATRLGVAAQMLQGARHEVDVILRSGGRGNFRVVWQPNDPCFYHIGYHSTFGAGGKH